MRLKDRVALVTGASRGIGRAIALEFAREGADVAVNYRKQAAAAEETAAAVRARGRRAVVIQADISDADACRRMVAEAEAALGPLDIAVANGGLASRPNMIVDLPVEEWHRVLATDLHGCFYTVKAVIGGMLERGRGVVLTVSSIGADKCAPGGAPYYVSKAGVNALTRTLANEVAGRGIRVNAIAPGVVLSDMGERMVKAVGPELVAGIPLGRAGQPEEVAKLAAFLASDDAAWITGKIYRIDGGVVGI
jgi:NAD(P)-dependent dehydrogenase (short-subunit alcohol dehydrogenase family)